MTQRADDHPVLVQHLDAVALLTFNRPAKLNAWTDELGDRYMELLASADADPEIRTIVVTGAGRGFCSGMDIDQLALSRRRTREEREHARVARSFALRVRKPLIAAVNGPAAGLGLIQALLCDVRFAAADAKLTTAFARLGLPAEEGLAWLLPRLIGQSRALDLLMSARVILGTEAQSIGLVDHILPAREVTQAAVDYARTLADQCSPTAMATIKQQVRRDATTTFAEARDRSFALMLEAFDHSDQLEGALAFAERRAPRFAPLGNDDG